MSDGWASLLVVAGAIVFIWVTGYAAFALQKWAYIRRYGP